MTLRETVDKADNTSLATLIMADFIDKNYLIDEIEPVVYQGGSAGLPLGAYNLKIMYFAIELIWGGQGLSGVIPGVVEFRDQANNVWMIDANNSTIYESVAAQEQYSPNYLFYKNVFFWRLTDNVYSNVQFIGYKINLK